MWSIASQGEKWVILKSGDREFRLAVRVDLDEDTDPAVNIVHPCRTCGWANSCKEGCHS